MTIIKPRLIDIMRRAIETNIASAVVTINATDFPYQTFYTDVEGNRIRVYVYVDDREGVISNAKLVDSSGVELMGSPMSIVKGEDGHTIVFETNISLGVI